MATVLNGLANLTGEGNGYVWGVERVVQHRVPTNDARTGSDTPGIGRGPRRVFRP